MKLLDYMKANALSDAAFASRIGNGVTPRAVKKWKYGETYPRLPEISRIEEITAGAVRSIDFLPPESAPPASREEVAE